jgi:hypothetical protein
VKSTQQQQQSLPRWSLPLQHHYHDSSIESAAASGIKRPAESFDSTALRARHWLSLMHSPALVAGVGAGWWPVHPFFAVVGLRPRHDMKPLLSGIADLDPDRGGLPSALA